MAGGTDEQEHCGAADMSCAVAAAGDPVSVCGEKGLQNFPEPDTCPSPLISSVVRNQIITETSSDADRQFFSALPESDLYTGQSADCGGSAAEISVLNCSEPILELEVSTCEAYVDRDGSTGVQLEILLEE